MDEESSSPEQRNIDSQLLALRRELQKIGHVRTTSDPTVKSARRVAEALVIVALAGLGGSIWLLRESVAVLQSSQASARDSFVILKGQVDRIDSEGRRNSEAIAEIRGRVYRGIQEGKDPYATDK